MINTKGKMKKDTKGKTGYGMVKGKPTPKKTVKKKVKK